MRSKKLAKITSALSTRIRSIMQRSKRKQLQYKKQPRCLQLQRRFIELMS